MADYSVLAGFNKPPRPVPKYVQTSTLKESGLLTTPIKRPYSDQVHSRTRLKMDPPLSQDISETPKVAIRSQNSGGCPERKREDSRRRKRITRQTPTTFTESSNDQEKSSKLLPKLVRPMTSKIELTSKENTAPRTSEKATADEQAKSGDWTTTKDTDDLLNKERANTNANAVVENKILMDLTIPSKPTQSVQYCTELSTNHNATDVIQEDGELLRSLEDPTVISTPLPIVAKKGRKKQKVTVQKSEKKVQTKGHICDECGRTLTSHQCVDRHIEGKHLKLKNFICEHCGEAFDYFVNLKYHRLHVHSGGDREVVCDNCDKLFDPFVMISHIQHLRNCGHQKIFCNECDESRKKHPNLRKRAPYFSQAKLLHHKEIAHVPKKCQKCGITFENQLEYLQHLRNYHKLTLMEGGRNRPAEERLRTLICDGCDKTLSFHPVMERTPMRRFQRHMIRCTTKKAFDCKCCKAYYRRRKHRDQHLKEEHPHLYGRFICDICAHSTHSMCNLKSHMNTHPNEAGTRTEVVCDICNSVHNRLYFAKHIRAVHYKSASTTYACDHCQMMYSSTNLLAIHKMIHHGIATDGIAAQRFECESCNGHVYGKKSLTEHLLNNCTSSSTPLYRCLIDTIPKEEKPELVFSDYKAMKNTTVQYDTVVFGNVNMDGNIVSQIPLNLKEEVMDDEIQLHLPVMDFF